METFGNLILGFGKISNFNCMFMITFGTFLGIIIGALPGLTATTGVSIFLPMTFFMEPVSAIGFLCGIYCGGMYGGSITAILINTPGTPAGAATAIDGNPLAIKGQAYKALQIALYASVIGGIISCIVLIFVSPILAKIALKFGPAEYFAVALFGLTVVVSLSSGNLVKGLIAACVGLLLAFVGMDPIAGSLRLTFGNVALLSGFQLIPVLIGLFAMTEILKQVEQILEKKVVKEEKIDIKGEKLTFKELRGSLKTIIKGSLIGCFIGAVPATGGATAAFMSYNEAKRSSHNPEEFGKGSLEGVAASESANNGVTGATFIPLLTLGIPGDSVTAVMLGALIVQGLVPGPTLLQNNAATVFGIYAALMISNIAMLVLGGFGIRYFHRVTDIPKNILQPLIFALCCIGTFAANARVFDIMTMFVMGMVGYLMSKAKMPVVPVLLALILGPTVEENLRRGLVASGNSFITFISRPIAIGVLVVTIISLIYVLVREYKAKKKYV